MLKLTNLQRSVLLSACTHELGLAARPTGLNAARAAKQTAMFAEAGLAKEIRAKTGVPVWRKDGEGQSYALKILKAGREVLAIDVPPAADTDTLIAAKRSRQSDPVDPVLASIAGPKSTIVVGLMQRADGATIEDLIAATGWLPHSTRAALSGLRKKGVAIERHRAEEGGASIYRIAAPPIVA